MKKIANILFVLLALAYTANSQNIGVDNKGKSVFTHYSKADARLEISTDEPLSLSYIAGARETDYIRKKKLVQEPLNARMNNRFKTDTTVSKFSGVLLQVSMLNSDDYLTLTNILDIRPGLGLKVGYQNGIGSFKNLDEVPKLGAYAWGINAVFNMDNIKLYNTDNNKEEKKLPLTYGAEFNYSFFFKNRNKERRIRNVLALHAKFTRTWNDDDLISYQKIGDVTVLPNVVALQAFEGRFGKLKNDITKFRLAFSAPFYISHINPIPYFVLNIQSKSNPIYFFGVFTNMLAKSLTKTDFKIPTSLGIGIDAKVQRGVVSRPNVFIKGSISFGEFK